MKHLRKHCHKDNFRPVCLQLTYACFMAFIITFTWFLCITFFISFLESKSIPRGIDFLHPFFVILLYGITYSACMLVPFEAIILLFIHYFKIWPNIMYSRKLVVIITLLFLGIFSIMNKFSTLSEENNLCLSSIIIVGIIIVIRILALQRYNMYQLKFNGYYNNQQMDNN